MKLAFSICSLTCLPWSIHTFLCTSFCPYPTSSSSFLSLPLIIPSLYLCTNLFRYQSRPEFLPRILMPLKTPTVKKGSMKQISLLHVPNISSETRAHCAINMHPAHRTVLREYCQKIHHSSCALLCRKYK